MDRSSSAPAPSLAWRSAPRERPIRLWLARFDNTAVRYPAKLEAEGVIGTARGKLLWFRERPLSPADGAAMQK
jgi:hypothetical protein